MMKEPQKPSSHSPACRAYGRLCMAACLMACAVAGPVLAQQTSDGQTAAKPAAPNSPPAQTDTKKAPDNGAPPATPAVTDPRQAQIIADTQKLVKLSQELKAEVAKSNKDTLSLAVIKKAEEVEKLAKTLKDELANKSR